MWEPFWTSEVNIDQGGRYPLGLNRFHDGLENILIYGISMNANRLRYITYYTWVIGDIEKNEECKKYSDFVEFFRRRENALSIGLYMLNKDYSVQGSDKLKTIVEESKDEYECTFDLMQSNRLGAFGLYYVGTIGKFGLIERDSKGIYKLTESGEKLYNIAKNNLEKCDYYKNFRSMKIVPKETLIELGKINDLDNIKDNEFILERDFFKNIIFYLDKKKVSGFRRDTFMLFLDSIKQCSQSGRSSPFFSVKVIEPPIPHLT
jgi:hypothetical protein